MAVWSYFCLLRLKWHLFKINVGSDGVSERIGNKDRPIIVEIVGYLVDNEKGDKILKKYDNGGSDWPAFGNPVGSLGG